MERRENRKEIIKLVLQSIETPKFEDFESAKSVEELQEMWEKNHRALRTIVETCVIPYFGLHGTSKENVEKIESDVKTGGEVPIEVGTFYNKPGDLDMFLAYLYGLADYCIPYGFFKHGGKEGSIMVCLLEKNKENIVSPWEPLLLGGHHLSMDTDGYASKPVFKFLEKESKNGRYRITGKDQVEKDNQLLKKGFPYRSQLRLQKQNWKTYKGVYSGDVTKFTTELHTPAQDILARPILRRRLWTQEILKNVFAMLDLSPK